MQGCSSIVSVGITITTVRTFLKLVMMIEHIKMMQTPQLDIWSMILSGQVPHRMEQFKSLVLESQRPCASSNTVL